MMAQYIFDGSAFLNTSLLSTHMMTRHEFFDFVLSTRTRPSSDVRSHLLLLNANGIKVVDTKDKRLIRSWSSS